MPTTISSKPPVLTGARQTMLSWAKVIDSFESVPEVYRDFFATHLGSRQAFPYVVLTPAIDGLRFVTTEKLVCDIDDTLYVLEPAGSQVVATGYPVQAIHALEMGTILLYSWITIQGVTQAGTAAASTIEFNTATGRHFASILTKIRPAPNGADEAALLAEQAKLEPLAALSYKFMNFARTSLVRGETVLHTVWQPEIRVRAVNRIGWPIKRLISTAHLTMLTDQELILIREDERSRRNKGVRYGGAWQYIPRRSIVSLSLSEPADDRCTLSIGISGNGQIDQVFAAARRPELEQLQKQFRN